MPEKVKEMDKCYIISVFNKKGDDKLVNIVKNSIVKASGSPIVHTQHQIGTTMYECTYPEGFKKTENYVWRPSDYRKRQPFIKQPTERQIGAMIAWWEDGINKGIKYGIVKLITFIILAKTKKFWTKIGVIPMTLNRIWGEFCSAAVDTDVKFSGIDLLPGRDEELTSPGEIPESKELGNFEK